MVIDFGTRLLLLGAYVLVPGAAALVLVRFRFSSLIDASVACAATGVAWTSACVYCLLFVNLYSPFTAALILLVPGAWLIGMLIQERRWPETVQLPGNSAGPSPLLDRLVTGCVVVMLLSIFIDGATSPVTGWDGNVTWDKWATDWARRQNSYDYLLGGYPQLLPMFSSVLYKLTGTYHLVVPLEQYVLHATQVAFAFVLLAAVVRLCRALALPAWPAVSLTFGHPDTQTAITNGSADLLLITFTMAVIALLLTFVRGSWNSRYGAACVVAPLLFGACFSKANGVLVLLYPLSYYVFQRVWLPSDEGLKRFSRASIAAMVLVPVLAIAPFYIYQVSAGARASAESLDAHEVNLSTAAMLPTLQHIGDRSFSEPGFGTRLIETVGRLGTSFGVPAHWLGAASLGVLVLLLASLRRRLSFPLVIPAFIIAAIWYRVTPYDLRNLLPALPVVAVLATAGAVELRASLPRARVVLVVLTACSTLLAVLSGGVLLVRAAKVVAVFRPDPSAPLEGTVFARRVAAMQGTPDDRIRLFFPSEWPTYSWVRSLRPFASAEHVIATAHMYRWFRGGSYPLSHWYSSWVRPGDIFVGSSPWRPPSDDQWTLVRDADGFKVWILDVNPRIVPLTDLTLTGATPPSTVAASSEAITLSLNGAQGLVVQNVTDRDLRPGSSIVWQALVDSRDATPAVRPGFLVYDTAVVDPQRTGVAVDVLPGDQHLVALSGILTLSGKALSPRLTDGILVGITTEAANTTLRVRGFRVSIYR